MLALAAVLLLASPPCGGELAVRSETGAPLPGAEVLVLEGRELMSLFQAPFDSLEAEFARRGVTLVADAEGMVRLPPLEDALLWGRSGDRRGFSGPGAAVPAELMLAPCPRVAVRVVDAQQRPAAGVRVLVRGHAAGAQVLALPAGITDGAGALEFLHFFPLGEAFGVERWSAGLALFGGEPEETFYDPAAPAAQPMVLVRPVTGSLLLRAVDEHGAALNEDLLLGLAVKGDARPTLLSLPHGELRLDDVLVGGRMQLSPFPAEWRAVEAELEGPSAAGEVRELRVVFARAAPDPERISVSARLLGPDGAPLAREAVDFSLDVGASSSRGGRETSGTDGRLALTFDRETLGDEPAALTLLIERKDGTALQRAVLLPEPAGGRVDLGDVALKVAPVMTYGWVLDADGRPVPGAEVEFSFIDRWLSRNGGPAGASRELAAVTMRADGDGHFELRGVDRGFAEHSEREVRARAGELGRSRWQQTGAPGEEVVLRLSVAAFVRGRLALAPGVDATALRVDALYRGELPVARAQGAVAPARDGSFELGPVAAEPCDLALWIDPAARALDLDSPPDAVLENVLPGDELEPWDLRETVHAYELAVLTQDGKPAQAPTLFYSSGGREVRRLYSGLQGRKTHAILSLDHPLTVRVEQEGMRSAEVTLDGPRGEVSLSAGIALAITVANLPDLGEHGSLEISLSSGDGPNPRVRGKLDRYGSGEVVALDPGTYTVSLQYLRQVGGFVWYGASSGGDTLATLEVTDGPGQTFALTLAEDLVETFRRETERRL